MSYFFVQPQTACVINLKFLLISPLMFIPIIVCRTHWVVYCINLVHKQIDILDYQNCAQQTNKDQYHARFCLDLQQRLSDLLAVYIDMEFPDISH